MTTLTEFKYQIDTNIVAKILLLDVSGLKDAYGLQPSGNITHDFHIKVSRNAKEFGIRPRMVRWQAEKDIGNGNVAKKTIITPILSISSYNSITTGTNGTTFDYKGLTYKAKSKQDQKFI